MLSYYICFVGRRKTTSSPVLRLFSTTIDTSETLLREYGLTATEITTIFKRSPPLSRADPVKNLKPKLNFLSTQIISPQNLASLIFKQPAILARSLPRKLIPCITFLKSFTLSDKDLLYILSSKGSQVIHRFTDSVPGNVELLRDYGVPYENVVKLYKLSPATLSRECGEFEGFLKTVDEMGLDRERMMFIHGLYAATAMNKNKWGMKIEALRLLGFSDGEIKELVRRQPKFMMASVQHMRKSFGFFNGELGWSVADVLKYPTALLLSFEKTILPRANVVKVLMEKGLLSSKCSGPTFILTEDVFLKKYVLVHEKEVPGLLELYGKNRNVVSSKE